MARNHDLTSQSRYHRLNELASIFAAAIVRLSRRSVLTDGESQKPDQTCLEVPPKTSLNGHHG